MEKQRTVNTVTANDGFSSGLMDSYDRWMGGDTFQNSTIKEEEIPTGQKQGGGTGAAFTSVNGSLPAIEFDKSTGLPTIPELGVTDETGKKDPKASSTGGEPPTNPQGLKPKYGAQIRNTVLVGANEEAACDTREEGYGKKDKKEKVKKEDLDIMDTEEWKSAAKKQTSRIMDIWKKNH
jgi:hypothetical protein